SLHHGTINAIAWSKDGKWIASGSSDFTVRVWNAQNGQHLLTYDGHSQMVNTLAWSPDGTMIASGSDDSTVQVWDAHNGHHLLTYHGDSSGVDGVAWSPDGSHIASGSWDTTVQVWEPIVGSGPPFSHQSSLNANRLLYIYHGHLDAVT